MSAAVIESASEQPAPASGSSTVLSGFRIFAVSAMKWTPQSTITSARSEEHTSELQSLMRISYAVFCLQKQNHDTTTTYYSQLNVKTVSMQIIYAQSNRSVKQ